MKRYFIRIYHNGVENVFYNIKKIEELDHKIIIKIKNGKMIFLMSEHDKAQLFYEESWYCDACKQTHYNIIEISIDKFEKI